MQGPGVEEGPFVDVSPLLHPDSFGPPFGGPRNMFRQSAPKFTQDNIIFFAFDEVKIAISHILLKYARSLTTG